MHISSLRSFRQVVLLLSLAVLLTLPATSALIGLSGTPAQAGDGLAQADEENCQQKFRNSNDNVVAALCFTGHDFDSITATLESRGPLKGVKKFMKLRVCSTDPRNVADVTCRSDSGDYRYYAGPVNIGGWSCPWFDIVVENGQGEVVVGRRFIGGPACD